VAVGASTPALEAQRLQLGEGASGRAAQQRSPVFLRRTPDVEPDPTLDNAQLQSAIAVPLLHKARLVGTLAVGSRSADRVFT
jgi:putative methionine-R-sulfoxide reductase with GAF domain